MTIRYQESKLLNSSSAKLDPGISTNGHLSLLFIQPFGITSVNNIMVRLKTWTWQTCGWSYPRGLNKGERFKYGGSVSPEWSPAMNTRWDKTIPTWVWPSRSWIVINSPYFTLWQVIQKLITLSCNSFNTLVICALHSFFNTSRDSYPISVIRK